MKPPKDPTQHLALLWAIPLEETVAYQDPKPKPKKKPQPTADDSLAVEAYGPRGAAMRKTAATMGEGMSRMKPRKARADSTVAQKAGARIKRFLGR